MILNNSVLLSTPKLQELNLAFLTSTLRVQDWIDEVGRDNQSIFKGKN